MRALVGPGCVSAMVALALAGCAYDVPDVVNGAGGGATCEESFAPRGVAFDGETWLVREPLVGEKNSRTYVLSFWYRIVVQDQAWALSRMDVFTSANQVSQTYFDESLRLNRYAKATDDGGTKQSFLSNEPVVALTDNDGKATSWHHVLLLSETQGLSVYHDGVVVPGEQGDNLGEIDFTGNGGWGVGGTGLGDTPWLGELAEVYLALDTTFPDGETALASFRTAQGTPADLGCDGSLPTGTPPILYLTHRTGDVSEFAQNRGSGGGFAVNGTLTEGTSVRP